MYRVTTSRLGPDGRRINPTSVDTDRGEMSAADLTILLDSFVEIDPAENEEHDPHIVVAGRGAKLIIRTSRGRLQVYDVRDHAAPAVVMTVAGIIDRLDLVETSSPFQRADEAPLPEPTAPHRGIAFAMLFVGLVLNGYILYSVFYVESVNKKVEVKLITDADEVRTREAALAGIYATGPKIGDRVIDVSSRDTSASTRSGPRVPSTTPGTTSGSGATTGFSASRPTRAASSTWSERIWSTTRTSTSGESRRPRPGKAPRGPGSARRRGRDGGAAGCETRSAASSQAPLCPWRSPRRARPRAPFPG